MIARMWRVERNVNGDIARLGGRELVDFMRLLKPGTKRQNITFQHLEESSYFLKDIL